MTVPTLNSVAEFSTNGVTTNYPFFFKFLANEDLVVTYVSPAGVSAVLTYGLQYTVNGAGDEDGGSIVTTTALAGPGQLIVSREMDAYQQTSLRNQGKFLAETHEDVFDRLTMLIQQGFSIFKRALVRPFGRDYYDAENRRIANLADPIELQDATPKGWVSRFVGDLIAAIQGPINNAANIFYQAPDGTAHVVQDLSGAGGTDLIGRGTAPGSLEDYLVTLATQAGVTADIAAALAKTVTHLSTLDGSGRGIPDSNHFMRYALDLTKRPKPPGASWLPFDILGMQANGKVAVSKTALQIMNAIATLPNASPTEGYVDNQAGSNANTGTLVLPWLTLTYAVTQAAYWTRLSAGIHEPFLALDRTGTTGDRVRRFYGSGNPRAMTDIDDANVTTFRIVGDDLTTKTWTLNAGAPILAQCSITAGLTPQAVMMTRYRDEFGRPKPLPLRTSATEVANIGGWYFSAGTLYVRCSSNAEFDTKIKPYLKAVYTRSDSTGYVRFNGAEAYFENCAFIGFFPLVDNLGGFPGKVVFKNCSFWYSRVSAVLATGGHIVMDNCEIYRCRGDGVNSHSENGIEAMHITINTDARYCGDIDTLGTAIASNENGMSIHENGNSAVLGGTIYKSSGPGLIDTGSGPGSTGVSIWYGVHSEDSQGSNPTNFDTYGVRTVYMESCSERGDAEVPVRSSETGTILRNGPNAVRGYTQVSGGVVAAYDPLNPV